MPVPLKTGTNVNHWHPCMHNCSITMNADLSGYRFGDALFEDGDSLHSDDSAGRHDDSDEFADDEGMSNADSSSQVHTQLCLRVTCWTIAPLLLLYHFFILCKREGVDSCPLTCQSSWRSERVNQKNGINVFKLPSWVSSGHRKMEIQKQIGSSRVYIRDGCLELLVGVKMHSYSFCHDSLLICEGECWWTSPLPENEGNTYWCPPPPPQEYLEDVNYLADDEMYSDFYMPFSWRNKGKLGKHQSSAFIWYNCYCAMECLKCMRVCWCVYMWIN